MELTLKWEECYIFFWCLSSRWHLYFHFSLHVFWFLRFNVSFSCQSLPHLGVRFVDATLCCSMRWRKNNHTSSDVYHSYSAYLPVALNSWMKHTSCFCPNPSILANKCTHHKQALTDSVVHIADGQLIFFFREVPIVNREWTIVVW